MAYSQIKNWESIMISIILLQNDDLPLSHKFYQWVMDNLRKESHTIALELIDYVKDLK